MARMVKVYEVMDTSSGPGKYGDGVTITRFRSERDAAKYAAGKTCYGGAAKVTMVEVPPRIAARWGV